jgi:AbrB family looped-hinge helix DNA binding protein
LPSRRRGVSRCAGTVASSVLKVSSDALASSCRLPAIRQAAAHYGPGGTQASLLRRWSRSPGFSARIKVCAKAQLTLPEEIRRALHIGEGDEVEFSVHDDGTVTVRGYVSIPTDQAWFFTPEWLAGEREADEDIAASRGTVHESAEDMFAYLDALGAADA